MWRGRAAFAACLLAVGTVVLLWVHAAMAPRADAHAVVLLAGQSNMVGMAPNDGLRARDDGVLIYHGASLYCGEAPLLRELQLGTSTCMETVGPEWGLADALAPRFDRVTLVKHAFGGTSLDWWDPGAALFERLVDDALHVLDGTQLLLGLAWMQGESDASDPALAARYAGRFAHIVGNLSLRLGRRVRVVAGLVQERAPGAAVVNAALARVADATVDTRAYTYLDGIHYDLPSTLRLGREFARLLVER